jgi:hypothetical protein
MSACIEHVLAKFTEKVVSFGTRFSFALSDDCIFIFSYCIRPPSLVDRFVSYKDINRVDAVFFELPGGIFGLGCALRYSGC